MNSSDGADPYPAPAKRVLVIDDEPRSVAGVIMELDLRGIAVDRAVSRQEAEAHLAEKAYDAVLLDLMLPECEVGEPRRDPALTRHGFSLLDSIRDGAYEEGGTGRDVPVAVITGIGTEVRDVAQQLRSRSIDHVFIKPTTPVLVAETLLDAMEEESSC